MKMMSKRLARDVMQTFAYYEDLRRRRCRSGYVTIWLTYEKMAKHFMVNNNRGRSMVLEARRVLAKGKGKK